MKSSPYFLFLVLLPLNLELTLAHYLIDKVARVLMETGDFSSTTMIDEGKTVYRLSCRLSFS